MPCAKESRPMAQVTLLAKLPSRALRSRRATCSRYPKLAEANTAWICLWVLLALMSKPPGVCHVAFTPCGSIIERFFECERPPRVFNGIECSICLFELLLVLNSGIQSCPFGTVAWQECWSRACHHFSIQKLLSRLMITDQVNGTYL